MKMVPVNHFKQVHLISLYMKYHLNFSTLKKL